MPEAVRLVIWDLDDTFWKGTLTEGGVTEYLQKHHDIVIELARRGIMSSICSKNEPAAILQYLGLQGILDYFIFPSISLDPKGPRLAPLIEAVQLRPSTVMFIDDNPGNRGEASAFVPDLQVEDETFIAGMLSDPRFKGKKDSRLSRLAQYKLLEARSADRAQCSGDNAEFLRGCDVRVYLEYDVMSHIDRAIELINRANQLNYTKKRLPEDIRAARIVLEEELAPFNRQAGLVRVVDKYGDYGYVGFYMLQNRRREPVPGLADQTLIHYCFSCRTLGMMVERWLYDWLRRPELKIAGAVLTDLNDARTIDWIRLAGAAEDGASSAATMFEEIRVHGGCEANAIAHYLGAHSRTLKVSGNFAVGGAFVRFNAASLLLSACDRKGPPFELEAASLTVPYNMMISHYFDDVPHGTLFVFSGALDGAKSHRYRHKRHGWEIRIDPGALPELNLFAHSEVDLIRKFNQNIGSEANARQVLSLARHILENYECIYGSDRDLVASMHALLERIPVGSSIVFVLDAQRVRALNASANECIRENSSIARYNETVRDIIGLYKFAGAVCFDSVIRSESEIQFSSNHYDRMAYFRLAEEILATASHLPPKTEDDALNHREIEVESFV